MRSEFDSRSNCQFYTVLKSRVNDYFATNLLSKKGGRAFFTKAIVISTLFICTYTALLAHVGGTAGFFLAYSLLGVWLISYGMNIAHDALHAAAHYNPRINKWLGYLMDVTGKSSSVWTQEHNIEHHTYTNVAGLDGDLQPSVWVLRFCPSMPQYWFHKYQHLYAPFLYLLIGFFNVLRGFKLSYEAVLCFLKNRKEIGKVYPMVLLQLIHFLVFLVIPFWALNVTFAQCLLGYFCCISVAGFIAAVVTLPAHLVDTVAFPLLDHNGNVGSGFAEHQLRTTSNYGTESFLTSYLVGGVNFQIEHHLFPGICHTHYYHLAPIVKATAKEFGLPYHDEPSLWAAFRSHLRTLKKFGRFTPSPTVD